MEEEVSPISYSLAITNGDLEIQGNELRLVFGVDKLRQDFNAWIQERYGGDRFHLNYGSILQDFVGHVVDEDARDQVYAEVLRVARNYQAVQKRAMQDDPTLLSHSEMLVDVTDVSAKIDYDTVSVSIKLINGSDQVAKVGILTTTT